MSFWGKKEMMEANLFLLIISVILYGVIYNFENHIQLFFILSVFCRIIQGVAVATIGVICCAVILTIFPKEIAQSKFAII